MQSANEIKQAIRQLPIQQRAVAIALKKIFDQVKELTKKQQQEIDANHMSFISRFHELENKAAEIIQGKKILTEDDLDKSVPFFNPEEQPEKTKLMKSQLPIVEYWFKAINNSEYGQSLTNQQQQILKSVANISTSITTNQITLTLQINSNPFFSNGTFNRRLVLDNGMPIKLQGEQPQWISQQTKMDGLFTGLLMKNTNDNERLATAFAVIGNLINEIVPYSLQYYLGAVDEDGQQQEGEQQGQQEDEQEQEEQ